MSDKYFIDTNIWLYAFSEEENEQQKTASVLIAGNNILLDTQVLNEICFYLVSQKKYKESDIVQFIKNMYRKFDILKPNEQIILFSSFLRGKYQIEYWESQKIACAIKNDCNVVFTDALPHELKIREVENFKILNPFKV